MAAPLLACAAAPPTPPSFDEPLRVAPPSGTHLEHLVPAALGAEGVPAWVATSALVGWYRSSGDFEAADRLLEQAMLRQAGRGLEALFALWLADQALYRGAWELAQDRYDHALALAGERTFIGRRLSVEVLSQRALARAEAGEAEDAVKDLLEAASRASHPQVGELLSRAADIAWRQGDRRGGRRLLRQAEEIPATAAPRAAEGEEGPGRRPRLKRRTLPSMEALALKAPWEEGISQRCGALGPQRGSFVRYTLGGLAVGRRSDPCGRGPGGYYYGRMSHSEQWRGGRDLYAIDFTRGSHEGLRAHNRSFGIQVRAPASGVVVSAWYGTPTHRGGWSRGPTPPSNRVDLVHLLPDPAAVAEVLDALEPPWTLETPWAWQSWHLHLVGLADACDRRSGRCVRAPALVSFGQLVFQGSPLGYQDSTGLSALDHLHFEVLTPCTAREERCADPQLTHVSMPPVLEGRAFGAEDVRACLTSTNRQPWGGEGVTPEVARWLKPGGSW